jgi:hypothetical protein
MPGVFTGELGHYPETVQGQQPPTVVTNDATNVTTNSARLNGTLTGMGECTPIDVSFVWGTSSGGPYPNETSSEAKGIQVPFYFDLSSLTPGQTYYYIAKADGGVCGTSYGSEKSFTTLVGTVGGEAYPVSKVAILAPWLGLLAALLAGATIVILRFRLLRRSSSSQ